MRYKHRKVLNWWEKVVEPNKAAAKREARKEVAEAMHETKELAEAEAQHALDQVHIADLMNRYPPT